MRRPRVVGLIKSLGFIGALCVAVVFGAVIVPIDALLASAAQSPIERSTNLDMYFPGTEDLAANEMRVVSCGTGMPAQRKSQAATCWLVELGNGDKFLFDIGTGSTANLGSLNIPYDCSSAICTLTISAIWMPCGLAVGPEVGRERCTSGGPAASSRRPARSTRWIT